MTTGHRGHSAPAISWPQIGSAFMVGFLFAIGLGVAGMTQPEKIVGFLDLFGQWDPALIFVMAGAVTLHAAIYHLMRQRQTPFLDRHWHVPHRHDLPPTLFLGSFLFGVGWALGGYCPGPALVSLASLTVGPAVFVGSMIVGMLAYRPFEHAFRRHWHRSHGPGPAHGEK